MFACYFIGNGFDLALGMDTGYTSFIKWIKEHHKDFLSKYQKEDYPNIAGLEDEILWSNFEEALGKCTIDFKTAEKYNIFYDSVIQFLKQYIMEQNDVTNDLIDKNNINMKITNILSKLNKNDREKADKFLNVIDHTYIISYNYTNVLDKFFRKQSIEKYVFFSNERLFNNTVLHIHYDLRKKGLPISGVNDATQIANEDLRSELTRTLVKPAINEDIGDKTAETAETYLKSSNIYFIYGLAFGVTDKLWWELIGNEILNNNQKCLFISYYSEKDYTDTPFRVLINDKNQIKEKFLAIAFEDKYSSEDFQSVKQRLLPKIFVLDPTIGDNLVPKIIKGEDTTSENEKELITNSL